MNGQGAQNGPYTNCFKTTDIEAQQPVPSSQEFLISLLFLVSVFISAVSGIAVGITLKDAKMGLSVSAFVLTIGTVVAPVAGLIPGQSQ